MRLAIRPGPTNYINVDKVYIFLNTLNLDQVISHISIQFLYCTTNWVYIWYGKKQKQLKLELVYLPKGKYCVYPRMVYRLAPGIMTFFYFENDLKGDSTPFIFRKGFVSHWRSYMMQYILVVLRNYWIISIIMGKWTKPDLSDLANDPLNTSMKSISWQFQYIIPKKLYTRNK